MTSDSRKYTPDGEPIESFIANQQAMMVRFLVGSNEHKKITETFYNYALGQYCEADDWDGASEYFQAALEEFIEQCQHYEYYRLLERAEKGEELLAGLEPNDINYPKWRKGLDELYRQIEQYQRESPQHQPSNGQRAESA